MSLKHVQSTSECCLISQSLIPLSASDIAFKPVSLYGGSTLNINSDDLQAICYTNSEFCLIIYIEIYFALNYVATAFTWKITLHYATIWNIMFHTIVHWHKLGEVDSECTLHNFIILAIFVPKIIKFSENLTKFWQKTILTVFSETWCICHCLQYTASRADYKILL